MWVIILVGIVWLGFLHDTFFRDETEDSWMGLLILTLLLALSIMNYIGRGQ